MSGCGAFVGVNLEFKRENLGWSVETTEKRRDLDRERRYLSIIIYSIRITCRCKAKSDGDAPPGIRRRDLHDDLPRAELSPYSLVKRTYGNCLHTDVGICPILSPWIVEPVGTQPTQDLRR